MSPVARVVLVLLAVGAFGGAVLWRVEQDVDRARIAMERQPAEGMVHARRLASLAFSWQSERLAARAMLASELQHDPTSRYVRRTFEHSERARRSYVSVWKVLGVAGLAVFILAVILAISSSKKRRLALGLLASIGFTAFALGMGLL